MLGRYSRNKVFICSEDVLLNLNVWLSDDHIDAAQKLLGDLGAGVGGLNTVLAVTYSNKLINVPENITQAIQCHNIGHHWVVHGFSWAVYINKLMAEDFLNILNNNNIFR